MKRQITLAAVIIGAGLLLSLSPTMATAEDFYQGKTIRFIVGAPAGGGYDTILGQSRAILANIFRETHRWSWITWTEQGH